MTLHDVNSVMLSREMVTNGFMRAFYHFPTSLASPVFCRNVPGFMALLSVCKAHNA